MKSWHTLAWKELKAQKVTSILIIIALILSTMMTTVIGQSIGILNAMREQQAASLNGNRYVTFHQLTNSQAEALTKENSLSYTGKMITIGRVDVENSNFSILLREYEGNALSAYNNISQLEKGNLPEQAGEIALPQDILSMLGFIGGIGDTITLPIHVSLIHDSEPVYEYTQDFVLTGILKSNYVGYVTGSTSGIVGNGTANKVLPNRYFLYTVDCRTTDKRTFQNTVDKLSETYHIPDFCIQYNDILLSALGIDYRTNSISFNEDTVGFSFMALSGILIGALILFAAGLVIYNILKISVTKKIKDYGTLRAIGGERGQLYSLVSIQLAVLCAIGIPIGAVLGILSTKGITTAATSFFSPKIFMASSQNEVATLIANNAGSKISPLLVSGIITLLFAFLAAMPAAHYAAKTSPTLAMSGKIVQIKRRNRSTGRIRSFPAFYARMNMKRNKGRTAITILSLVMSITVFVALQSFSSVLDASMSVQQMHLGDYSITNETVGFSPDMIENLRTMSGIQSISTLKYKLYSQDAEGNIELPISFALQPSETIHMVGIDEQRILDLLPDISQTDLQALKDGDACIIKNPMVISYGDVEIETTSLKQGENITVNGNALRITDIINTPITIDNAGFYNGIQIIVYDTVFDQITKQSNYNEVYPLLTDDANREVVEQAIDTLCSQTGGHWLSYENTDQQLAESFEQTRLLARGLILFMGLIGLLNIINTVYTNIHTRIKEIGTQRAIGMNKGMLYRTFLWESAYYGMFAAIIGNVGGYVCTIFAKAATSGTLQLVAIPFLPILQATALSIIACLLAACLPLRKIASMDIVSSIEAIE